MLNFKPLLIIAVSASLLASCGGGEKTKKDKSAQIKELKQQQKKNFKQKK
jgi:hypothetical protein